MIDVFKIGVQIGMSTNATQVLSAMLSQLTGIHIAAGKLQGSLNQVGKAAIGVGTAFVGWEIEKSIWKAIEGNRELNKELEKTKQLGGEFAERINQTRAAAFRTTNEAPTSVVSDNVRLSRELGQTLGHPQAAEEMLTMASKTAFLVHNYTGEKEEDIIKNLIRVADLRAQIYTVGPDGKEHVDPVKLQRELDAAYRGLVLGGGFVTSAGMLQTAKQAGAVAKEQTPEAFYAAGTEAAISMGASRLGTADTSLMQQFIGGTMTKKVAEHLTEAGLLHAGEWTSGKSGGVVINPRVAARFEPMMRDPVAWLETGEGGQAVRAFAEKEKISITAAIMQLFGRQTTQRLVNDAMSNEPQFARAREIYGNIPGVQAAYKEQMANNLDANMVAVSAAWKSFMEAFSDASVPLVIPILHGITEGLHLMMNEVADHPKITEALVGLAGGIAGLTALSGSILVLNVALGPLAGGLKLLVGISGLNAAGGSLVSLARGVSALVGVVAGAAAIKNGSDAATGWFYDLIHGKGHWDKVHSDMSNNPVARFLGLGGGEDKSSPYVPPGSGSQSVMLNGNVNLDGKKVGNIVAEGMADNISRPPTGGNAPDLRVSPWMPGLMGVGY